LSVEPWFILPAATAEVVSVTSAKDCLLKSKLDKATIIETA